MGGNSDDEVDLDAAMDEIAADLFSEGEDEASEENNTENLEDPSPSEGQEQLPEGVTPPEGTVPAQTSPEVQEIGAPKTWTKDAIADWATIPDRAKQEILKREEDFFRGIEGYKELAERGRSYEQVIEPYRPVLAAANVDPVQLFSAFASNHYMLSMGSPEEKLQIAANLMQNYGIDPIVVAQRFAQASDGRPHQVDPEVAHLRQQLATLQQQVGTQQQFQQQAAIAAANDVVAEFKINHEFFDDVSEDMIALIEKGAATTLQEAYDIAIYRNAAVRDKVIAAQTRMAVPSTSSAPALKKAALKANVKTSAQPKSGTVPVGSLDETLEEVYGEIMSRAD